MKETKRIIKALSKKQTYAITSALLLTSGLGTGIYNATQDSVTLTIDGEVKTVQTHAKDIESLFKNENISYEDGDQLSQSLDTKIEDGMNINLFTEKEVTVRVGNSFKKVYTTGLVVKDAIEAAGYTMKEQDKISPAVDEIIEDGSTIAYDPAFEVTLNDGTKTKKVWTTATTVNTFLKNQNIVLGEHDKLSAKQFDLLDEETEVTIDRIEKKTTTVKEEVDYEIVEKKDYSLEKGKTRVVTKGTNGVIEKEYNVTYVNGKQKEKELVSEKVVTKSKNQVVAVGAKEAVTLSSRSSQTTASTSSSENSGREFYVEATAYTPYCAGCSGLTAAGYDIRSNPNMKLIAVDPSVIPLGTKVYVEGYGYAIAGDTGGAIKGNKIDLLMPTKSEAYSWGRRTVKIRIVN